MLNGRMETERSVAVQDTCAGLTSSLLPDLETRKGTVDPECRTHEHRNQAKSQQLRVRFRSRRKRMANDLEICSGFIRLADPLQRALKECPRQAYFPIEKLSRPIESEPDEFGIVSRRALPDHYYVNTGSLTRISTTLIYGKKATLSAAKDHTAVLDFSHPKCFANPDNNIRMFPTEDEETDSGDDTTSSLKDADVIETTLTEDHNKLNVKPSKTIRFESFPRIIELDPEEDSEASVEDDTAIRERQHVNTIQYDPEQDKAAS